MDFVIHKKISLSKRSHRKGQAIIELAILAPWIFFLFISVADFGFCSYAAISIQNAARSAVLYTSSSSAAASDSTGACAVVRRELQSLPNYSSSNAACSAAPLQVTAQKLSAGPDGNPAAQVTVTYQTIPLVPVPLLFSGSLTLVRTVEMPLSAN